MTSLTDVRAIKEVISQRRKLELTPDSKSIFIKDYKPTFDYGFFKLNFLGLTMIKKVQTELLA